MIVGKSTRYHERVKMQLPLQVTYHESAEDGWAESTQTEEITICGGGFVLPRPVEPNRLINLRFPMPKRFRLYALEQENYEVWGVVRYIKLIEPVSYYRIFARVGTALIGAHPPHSYLEDPTTKYDLKPVLRRESLWDYRELPRFGGKYYRSSEERRNMEMLVSLEILDESGKILEMIETKTLNISESGMAVLIHKNLNFSKYVLVRSRNKAAALLAVVRGWRKLDGIDFVRLHIEFISGKWNV